MSDKDLAELKESFMEAYDDNKDGKIEIREVFFFFVYSSRMWNLI